MPHKDFLKEKLNQLRVWLVLFVTVLISSAVYLVDSLRAKDDLGTVLSVVLLVTETIAVVIINYRTNRLLQELKEEE